MRLGGGDPRSDAAEPDKGGAGRPPGAGHSARCCRVEIGRDGLSEFRRASTHTRGGGGTDSRAVKQTDEHR